MNSRWDDADAPQEKSRTRNFALAAESARWSLISDLHASQPERARAALIELVDQYAEALLHYLIGLPWRFERNDAEDIVQGFIHSRFLEGNLLQRADPQRGHFRGLLRTALDNFVRDRLRSDARRPKARGGTDDDDDKFAVDGVAPAPSLAEAFNVAWARDLIQQTIVRMRAWCQANDTMGPWSVFEARLLRPVTHFVQPVPYERLAERLGFRGPKEAANALITAKRIFRRTFNEVVGRYLDHDSEIDEEIEFLREVFAGGVTLAESAIEDSSKADFPADEPADRSWLLIQALKLPDHAAFWTEAKLEPALRQILSTPLRDLTAAAASTNVTLQDVLTAESPSLLDLQAVKAWTKQEFAQGHSQIPPEVVSAIYFATIAAARLRLEKTMTGLRDEALVESLNLLRAGSWITMELRNLFVELLDRLETDASQTNGGISGDPGRGQSN